MRISIAGAILSVQNYVQQLNSYIKTMIAQREYYFRMETIGSHNSVNYFRNIRQEIIIIYVGRKNSIHEKLLRMSFFALSLYILLRNSS